MAPEKQRMRLLIIEDNPVETQRISQMLTAAAGREFVVDAVAVLAEGLGILDRENFDAVLLDANLSNGSGTDTLREILVRHPDVPVIVISDAEDEGTAARVIREGARDYLIRGRIDGVTVAEAARRAIGGRPDRDRNETIQQEIDRRIEEQMARLGHMTEELTERNEFNFALFEHNPIETIVVDLEGKIVNFNRAKRLTEGRVPKVGELMYHDFAPGHENDMRRELMDAIGGGTVKHFPAQKYDDRYLAITISPFSRGAIITSQDITAQRVAQEALRESEEKYRLVVENAVDGVAIVRDGLISYLNPAACSIMGYPKGELIGRGFLDFVIPEEREEAAREYERKLSGDQLTYPTTFRFVGKDGSLRWAEVSAVAAFWEGKQVLLSFIQDVTDRKKTEEVLRQFEEKWRNFIETSRDIIFLTTLEGKIVDINPAGLELSGYTREEFIGKSIAESYANPRDWEPFIGSIVEKGFVKDFALDLIRKDGSVAHCLVTASQRKDKGGNVIGFHGIIKDVTEKKNLEQQLIQAQKMEAIVALAGGIAHTFNNILVGIMGYSEYLLSKKDVGDPDYKALKTINDGTIKASTLVGQLLDAARVGQYRPGRVNLNDIVTGTLPLVESTFEKAIEVTTSLGGDLLIIEGDAGQLEQSVLNLCINARDAMPSGGRLVIETTNRRVDRDFADTHLGLREGDHVVLSVSDTGVGMTPDVKERIFEPFFTTKEQAGGTGMGLSTVYGIMKTHGGKITVYSEPGKGTTFRLYFPALTDQSADTADQNGGRGGYILIIDDDPGIREVWGRFLFSHGFMVLVAENGQTGIELFRARRDEIDLVIVDLVMPGMGGKEAIPRLREIKPDIKVLGCSGYSANGQARDMVSLSPDGFIQKPPELSELLKTVKKIMDK